MANKQHSELKAGIFTIAALALLLGTVLWIGSSQLFQTSYGKAYFYSKFDTGPQGLYVDCPVKVGDVQVGKIAAIIPEPGKKRLIYEVDIFRKDAKLHADAEATVASGFLGGATLVVKDGGGPPAPESSRENPIEIPGGLMQTVERVAVKVEQAANDLAEITGKVNSELDSKKPGSILHDVKGVTSSLRAEFDGQDENSALARIKVIAERVLAVADKAVEIAGNLEPETDPNKKGSIAGNVKDASKSLASAVAKADHYMGKDVEEILVYVDKLYEDTDDILADVKKVSASAVVMADDAKPIVRDVQFLVKRNRENVDEIIDNLVTMSANADGAIRELRRTPWLLFNKPDEDRTRAGHIARAAEAFDNAAHELRLAVKKVQDIQYLDPDSAKTEQVRADLREQLEETIKKFRTVDARLWKALKAYSEPTGK